MSTATYVCFVPASKRGKLRAVLASENAGAVEWRERKRLFLSEFYFSGPASGARKAHAFVTAWLARD